MYDLTKKPLITVTLTLIPLALMPLQDGHSNDIPHIDMHNLRTVCHPQPWRQDQGKIPESLLKPKERKKKDADMAQPPTGPRTTRGGRSARPYMGLPAATAREARGDLSTRGSVMSVASSRVSTSSAGGSVTER